MDFSANLRRLREELPTMKASKFTEAQKAFILKQGEAWRRQAGKRIRNRPTLLSRSISVPRSRA